MGVVGHDLRNPLSAIENGAALLLRWKPGDREGRTITRIISSAQRATRILNDLLDFTRARSTGRISIRRAPTDLHTVVRDVVDEVRHAHPATAIRLVESPSGGALDCGSFDCDGDRIAQVLLNLLRNAIEHSAADSAVTVELESDTDPLVISVHNFGEPIAAEAIPSLFDPFTQGARRGRGIGLGLFIVRHIVEAHGGTIEVRSAAGAGTTFTVRLPRAASVQE